MSTASDWQIYRTRFLIRAQQLTAALDFTDALGREHCGKVGDYLVESSDGLRSIIPRRIFEDVYVAMGTVGDDRCRLPARRVRPPELKLEVSHGRAWTA